jgi:hypothetical protein
MAAANLLLAGSRLSIQNQKGLKLYIYISGSSHPIYRVNQYVHTFVHVNLIIILIGTALSSNSI